MKNYFTSLLVSLLICTSFAACSSDEEVVPETPKASIQIFYMASLAHKYENHIYKLELDGKTFTNNNSPVMYLKRCFPGNTSSWFLLETEKRISIKLYKGKNMELVYDKEIPPLEEGNYYIIIHNFHSEPVIVETSTMELIATSRIQFFNFMYESNADEPSNLTIQCQYCLANNKKEGWHNLGKPVSFGQYTGWIEQENIHLDIRLIDAKTGDQLQYLYWPNNYDVLPSSRISIYPGQHHLLFLCGTRYSTTRMIEVLHFSEVY
ncbi:MAG: hypothetical protein IJZ86_05130 [Bacteroides sp.]|nr:hypothetical protein [Bacteroides sp.]